MYVYGTKAIEKPESESESERLRLTVRSSLPHTPI